MDVRGRSSMNAAFQVPNLEVWFLHLVGEPEPQLRCSLRWAPSTAVECTTSFRLADSRASENSSTRLRCTLGPELHPLRGAGSSRRLCLGLPRGGILADESSGRCISPLSHGTAERDCSPCRAERTPRFCERPLAADGVRCGVRGAARPYPQQIRLRGCRQQRCGAHQRGWTSERQQELLLSKSACSIQVDDPCFGQSA